MTRRICVHFERPSGVTLKSGLVSPFPLWGTLVCACTCTWHHWPFMREIWPLLFPYLTIKWNNTCGCPGSKVMSTYIVGISDLRFFFSYIAWGPLLGRWSIYTAWRMQFTAFLLWRLLGLFQVHGSSSPFIARGGLLATWWAWPHDFTVCGCYIASWVFLHMQRPMWWLVHSPALSLSYLTVDQWPHLTEIPFSIHKKGIIGK